MNPEQELSLFNGVIKLLGTYSHPRDVIKRLAYFYKEETVLYEQDLRIKRLVDAMDSAVKEWDVPLGCPSIRKVDLTEQEKKLIRGSKFIAAIKLVRQRTGFNLKDSKMIVDNYRFGR